jgi:septum formation topological specificity factor MinE
MLRPTRPTPTRSPAPSAPIARARLQLALAANRRPSGAHQPPDDELLRRLLGESADEGRAA